MVFARSQEFVGTVIPVKTKKKARFAKKKKKNAKQPPCLNSLQKAVLPKIHSMRLNKTFFFPLHLTVPSAAWLGLA